jgi:CRP-like cAMP-binding protein
MTCIPRGRHCADRYQSGNWRYRRQNYARTKEEGGRAARCGGCLAGRKVIPMLNHVLATLPDGFLRFISPRLDQVSLNRGRSLELVRREIEHVYFLEEGVAAVISATDHKRIVVGLIGREGASGIGIFLGDSRSPHACEMLTDGIAHRLPSASLETLLSQYPAIRHHLSRYALAFYNQAAHTALSNSSSSVPRRLARWLLMVLDRLPGNEVPMTHDMIGEMLDVRRPGITAALQEMQDSDILERHRSNIIVLKRHALEAIAADFYGLPEIEYERLMGKLRPWL